MGHRFELPVRLEHHAREQSTFHRFGLEAMGYFPAYRTVDTDDGEKKRIEFFANGLIQKSKFRA